jgi:hypothetical protein
VRKLMVGILSATLMAGLSGPLQAQKEDIKDAGKHVKHATIKTGKAVKKGTKKTVHAGAKVTRKATHKVEKKTEK